MRIRLTVAAALVLTAATAVAQSRDLTGPRTLTVPMVMCTDLPAVSKPIPRLAIYGPVATDRRLAVATHGAVVIKRMPEDGLAVGQRFISQRIHGDARRFPSPGQGYGDLRITGWLTITALDELNALATVDFACDTVESGDFLEPYAEPELPSAAPPMVAPDFSDRGSVLFGADNRLLFGDGDILSIDRGTLHGVVPGARYALYRDRRDGIPLIYVGEAVVVSTAEHTSKAIVTRAVDGVERGDIAVPRRTP